MNQTIFQVFEGLVTSIQIKEMISVINFINPSAESNFVKKGKIILI